MAVRQLQVEAVIRTFEELTQSPFFVQNEELLRPLVDYFEDTWIGRPRGGNRRPPKFRLQLWNCYNGTIEDLPKTNNSVEGWHRAFSSLLASNHPIIWKCIEGIRKEQALNELKITQYLAGHEPPVGRKNDRDSADRIEAIVEDYDQRNMTEYLRGLAHNLQLQV